MHPVYGSVSELFEYKPCYMVPKYQRAYAWGDGQVEDFVIDIERAFRKRKNSTPIAHFFGGFICVKTTYPGTNNVNKFEIIDGQQRLTTFNLYANILIKKYREIKGEADSSNFSEISRNCLNRFEELGKRFFQFEQLISGNLTKIRVLQLSRRDNDFYFSLISGENPGPTKDSHEKLLSAYKKIDVFVDRLLKDTSDLQEKFNDLYTLEDLLSSDFMVLSLITETRHDAYRLFQVINDRGMSLTDADLIRCRVLELMEGDNTEQDRAEILLDQIVSHKNCEEHLVWVYESKNGRRPRTGAIFDDFMSNYFGASDLYSSANDDIALLSTKTLELNRSVNGVRELLSGVWPYEHQLPIEAWDRDRLSVLVEYLGNTAAIPLLLSATQLTPPKFSEIIQMLERFFYRYKIMCSGHNTSLRNTYSRHITRINSDPVNYDINNLRGDLNSLIQDKAPDNIFAAAIGELAYSRRSSNRNIKHLLLMLDQYGRWYDDGANGSPTCIDRSRILDRKEGTTLEHIYPKSLASTAEIYSIDMESVKNSLHNLTILSSTENSLAGVDDFERKKIVFKDSSSYITRRVADSQSWGIQEASEHYDYIKKASLSIFVA